MTFTLKLVSTLLLYLTAHACGLAQSPRSTIASPTSELLQQGQTLVSGNRLAEAEVMLTNGLASVPNDSRVMTLLGEVRSRLGDSAGAITLFRKVISLNPNSAEAYLNLAIALADTSSKEEALRNIEESIHLEPRNSIAHLNCARLLADLQRPTEARAEFTRAELLNPLDPQIDYFWAVFELDQHRPAAAVPLLLKVTSHQPDNAHAFFLLGKAQESINKPQEAVSSWQRAVAIDPSSEETVYALSQALRDIDPAQSAKLIERFNLLHAEKQKEERVREMGNQAYAAMKQQDWQSAVTALEQGIELCGACSLQADLHQRLGLAECHRGDLAKGERELRLALSLNPNDHDTVAALQWVAAHKQ